MEKLDELEKRVLELENALKLAKMIIGVFGISFALMFGYVQYLKTTAEQVTDEVLEKKDEAIETIKTQTKESKYSVINTAKKVFSTTTCRTIDKQYSCSDRVKKMTCNNSEYLVGITNHGGKNSCVKELKCCKINIE